MKIVADANIPIDSDLLPAHAELIEVEGRALTGAQLKHADALIVRSVTKVDADLLRNTPVEFVATATSGVDHLDLDFLREQGITWCDAAGSNANAVVDYCLASLAHWLLLTGLDIRAIEIGIVGTGHVGSRLAGRLQRLGCKVLLCDPPLELAKTSEFDFVPLDRIARCQVVSLHVPFKERSEFATHRMISTEFLREMSGSTLLINSCRGGVVDEEALLHHLEANENFKAVVDVWQNEPIVKSELAAKVLIATPHIAGYSRHAKLTAAEIVVNKLLTFLGESTESAVEKDNTPEAEILDHVNPSKHWETVLQVLPITKWSDRFKQLVAQGDSGESFDLMRRELVARKEFSELSIEKGLLTAEESKIFSGLGFKLVG
ncbi:MAG: 4-phosphoerythronate dehydrogenase [Pseudomonadales bacterium]|nr:4-phosphoerythronate dehydrogenase [Pseudomonadales bacterium]